MSLQASLALAFAYLIGSVSFAVVVARAGGVDIYRVGSGNPGASNVLRTMGRGAAAAALLGDGLKGFAAAAVGYFSGGTAVAAGAGLLAVTGHCFPLFHRFRGGKGMATATGVMLWLFPLQAAALALLWGVVVWFTKVASIGSLLVVVLAVPAAYLAGLRGWALGWVGVTAALILYRHRGNISRLIRGGERKVVS